MEFINKIKIVKEEINFKRFVLIIVFAIIFGFVVQDGIRLVIQKFLDIPSDYVGFVQWGNTFFLRILASLVGTATGAFIVGTFLKKRAKLAAVIATLPTVLFWITVLVFGIIIIADEGYLFETVKAMLVLPGILAILSPIVGYFGADWGQKYFDEFQRSRSILNIKWYHWFWILPFYLNKVIAIPLFTLILLWKTDLLYDTGSVFYLGIFDLISHRNYYFVRIITLFVFAGLIASINHSYSLLSKEKTTVKINWKNGMMIFGYVFFFSIIYIIIFREYF